MHASKENDARQSHKYGMTFRYERGIRPRERGKVDHLQGES
jgi:hypothetical protein